MNAKKTAFFGLMISLALILSFAETLISPFFPVPGIKIGLANAVALFILYAYGAKSACIVSVLRVFLASLLFGNAVSLVYSLCGAALSLCVMILLKKSGKFGIVAVSAAGGVAHNAGQIIAAAAMTQTAGIAMYMPVLCVSGTVCGAAVGIAAALILKRIKGIKP